MRVLLVDDHPLFTEGVVGTLLHAGYDVVDVAVNGRAGIDLLTTSPDAYDIALIDLTMPEMDGIEMLDVLGRERIAIPAVVLSATEDITSIALALRKGAFGFIPKSHNKRQLLAALAQITAGEVYMPEQIREQIEHMDPKQFDELEGELNTLSRRQLEVLLCIRQGMSNKKIAGTLYLSPSTVKYHLTSLFELLDASNRTECIGKAISLGLIE